MKSSADRVVTRFAALLAVVLALLGSPLAWTANAAGSGHVTGHVTDKYAVGIPGMQVIAYLPYDGGGWMAGAATKTTSDGSYDLAGLAADGYRIQFYDPTRFTTQYVGEFWNDVPTIDAAAVVSVADGATVADIDAALALRSHITGRLIDDEGAPVAHVFVQPYGLRDGSWKLLELGTYSNADGTYDLGSLSPGTFRLAFVDSTGSHVDEFWKDSPKLATATDIVVGTDVTVPSVNAVLTRASHITGRVSDANGVPLVGAVATTYRFVGGGWRPHGQAETDATGHFDVDGIEAGTYRVQFLSDGGLGEYWDNAPTLATSDDIVVGRAATAAGRDAVLDDAARLLTLTKPPAVSGTVQVGSTLTADPGSWSPGTATFHYQWVVAGRPVDGATSSRYRVRAGDLGRTVRVKVTASVSGHATMNASSAPTGKVKPGKVANRTPPRITGTARAGQTLEATTGRWTPGAVHLVYQWFLGTSLLPRATGRTLKVTRAMVGQRVKVWVTASAAGYRPTTVRATPSAIVKPHGRASLS